MGVRVIQGLLFGRDGGLGVSIAADVFSLLAVYLDGLLDGDAAAVVHGFITEQFMLQLTEAVGHALGHDARLIAGSGAQGVHRHGRLEQGLAVHGELGQFPGGRVKLNGEILAGHGVLVRAEGYLAGRSLEHGQVSLHGKLELVKGQFIALLGPVLVLLQLVAYAQGVFRSRLTVFQLRNVRYGHHDLFPGSGRRRIQLAFRHHIPVLRQSPGDVVRRQVRKEVLVEDGNPAVVRQGRGDILINVLHFKVARFRRAVRQDGAVEYELAAVGMVVEVAAVGEHPLPVRQGLVQALVHPVPDGAAHDAVGRFNSLPVVRQVAHGVHHVVRVL